VVMSYNVQNLFDDIDNGTEYSEYDPGTGNWDRELFLEKVNRISMAVKKAVPGGPDIVALQEIENIHTIEVLCRSGLKGMGYNYSVLVPTNGSAINTAILSRIAVRKVNAYSLPEFKGMPLRKIIEVEFLYKGNAVFLFNNHWKSKLGGEYETESARREAAACLISRLGDLYSAYPRADVIVLGDFNENIDEYIQTGGSYQTALYTLQPIGGDPVDLESNVPEDYKESSLFLSAEYFSAEDDFMYEPGSCMVFYEPWYDHTTGKGSYVYKNKWQTPDHILLSPGLFDNRGFHYVKDSFTVMDASFLTDPSTGYPAPWNSYKQDHGYSDHLPVLIKIACEDDEA